MRKAAWLIVALLGLSGVARSNTPPGNVYVLAPPSLDDILTALGADAHGLNLHTESLPDIFTLTAGRIDEDPKKFIVEEKYTGGRWVGGKVVIEYARDLSYTLVSVYDKAGKRQRIYSVTSKMTNRRLELALRPQPTQAVQDRAVEAESAAEPVPVESEEPVSTRSSVQKSERSARTPSRTSEAASPPRVESRQKRHTDGFEWDDEAGAYVPAKSTPKHAVAPAPAASPASLERPRDSVSAEMPKKNIKKSKKESAPPASSPPVAQVPKPASLEPVKKVSAPAASSTPVETMTGQVVETDVPSEDELLGISRSSKESPKAVPEPRSSPGTKPVEVASSRMTSPASPASAGVPSPAVPLPVVSAPPVTTSKASSVPTRPSVKQAPEPEKPAEARYVWDDETSSYVPESELKSKPKQTATPAAATVVSSPVEKPVSPPSTSGKKKSEEAQPVAEAAPAAGADESGVETETPTVPVTGESDAWVPKATPKPAVPPEEPVVKQPVKVAVVPKAAPPPSIDELLKIAAQSSKSVPNEGDAWVPKSGAGSSRSAEVDVNAELARLRDKKSKEKLPVPVKIKRDINNPEEGVLPINAFEKFSGPRYGRHREYERRVYWGKRPDSSLTNYDFYVDEVDRKKEIHNVYYYKKDKVPKLVAQERFDNVKFLSNYDVDTSKHSKAKVTRY